MFDKNTLPTGRHICFILYDQLTTNASMGTWLSLHDLGRVASPRAPVTVHLGAGVSPALVDVALDAAARTLDYCERALRLEGPWPDGLRGGDPGLDVYLLSHGVSDTPVDAMVTVAPPGPRRPPAAASPVRVGWGAPTHHARTPRPSSPAPRGSKSSLS